MKKKKKKKTKRIVKISMKTTNLSFEAKVMIGAGFVSLGLMLFAFITAEPIKYALGVFFGGLYSILNFRLMQLTFEKAIKMPSAKAQSYIQTRYFLRYLITGVVIYVALINPWLNIIGVFLGLIAVKLSIYLNEFLSKRSVSGNEA